MRPRYSRGRRLLVAVATLSLAVFVALSWGTLHRLADRLTSELSRSDWLMVGLAAAVLLLGHVLRAARTKVPIDNVRRGSLSGQFRHLSIGYLFIIVFPLRVGEVVRAWLIAKTLRISFLYTLTAVVLERLIDVVLVATGYLVFVLMIGVPANGVVPFAALIAVLSSVGLLVGFALLVRENAVLMRLAWRVSSWLNPELENRARFKLWSVIFGFQRFVRQPRQLVRYAALAFASWACYLAATAILAVTLLPRLTRGGTLAAIGAPYAVVSPSVGNGAPGAFLSGLRDVMASTGVMDARSLALYAAVCWVVLNVPILLVAVVALFVNWARTPPAVAGDAELSPGYRFMNKLGREQDISGSITHFLDAYFQRQSLSQVLHRMEVRGNVSLVQVFKGGSNAVTLLATSGQELFVKKMVPLEYAHRLKNQYEWLAERADHRQLVTVLREEHAEDYYAIDLEYRPSSVPLFEYVHENPLRESRAALAQVWEYMYRDVYRLAPAERSPDLRDDYITERFVGRVQAAAASHAALAEAMKSERIVVNGQELDNFDAILSRIRRNGSAWEDLANFQRSSHIHGDLTIDNILVDLPSRDVLVIDPSDDNQIRGPVIDFARHMQSLLYGYEFLNEEESPVLLGECDGIPEIVYRDDRSARYAELAEFIGTEVMPRHLTAAEQRSVLFHVGLFYGRMLTHRIVINPGTALKYYGVCIQAMNRFLEQYEHPRHAGRVEDRSGTATTKDQVLAT